MEVLRDPVTLNQRAQRRAFTVLYNLFVRDAAPTDWERPPT
jgi:hypothetical protein